MLTGRASTRSLRRRLPALLLPVAAVALAGCVGADRDATPTPAAAPTGDLPGFLSDAPEGMDPQLLGPLQGLGPCELDPEPVVDGEVPGLVLPPDAVVTQRSQDGPLTNVQGYLPYTPIQIRVFYETRAELDTIQSEDEIRESEVLLGDGEHRLFVKAQAVCDTGSVFVAVVAPEVASDVVPTPQGGQGP